MMVWCSYSVLLQYDTYRCLVVISYLLRIRYVNTCMMTSEVLCEQSTSYFYTRF